MSRRVSLLLSILALVALPYTVAEVEISINGSFDRSVESAALLYGTDINNVTASGRLTNINNETYCSDNVVLLSFKIPLEEKILFLQSCGSAGCIVDSIGMPGRAMYLLDRTDLTDFGLPCHQVSSSDFTYLRSLVESGDNVTVVIIPSPNMWFDVLESPNFLAVRIIFSLIAGGSILFTIYRIVLLMIRTDFDEDVLAKVLIFFILVDFLFRLLYLALDPFGSSRLLSFSAERILASLPFPFALAANFLLMFYWNVMLQRRLNINTGLYYMKAPAAFTVVTCFSLLVVLASLPVENDFAFALESGIYFAAVLPATIFIAVTFIRLKLKMNKSKRIRSRFSAADFRSANIVFASFLINCLMVIPFALAVNPEEYLTPVQFLTAWFLSYGLLYAVDILQVLAIQIPPKLSTRR